MTFQLLQKFSPTFPFNLWKSTGNKVVVLLVQWGQSFSNIKNPVTKVWIVHCRALRVIDWLLVLHQSTPLWCVAHCCFSSYGCLELIRHVLLWFSKLQNRDFKIVGNFMTGVWGWLWRYWSNYIFVTPLRYNLTDANHLIMKPLCHPKGSHQACIIIPKLFVPIHQSTS